MTKEVTAIGKDILEAQENARAALGAGELEDVQFEIIDAGTKGFFGFMSRPAKVRAFIELPDAAPKHRHEKKKDKPQREERREREERRDTEKKPQNKKPKPERKRVEPNQEKSAPKSEVIPEAELKMERRIVEDGEDMSYDFVKTLISDIGLNASAELYACEDGTRRIAIVGDDASALIGHHGDTLDALQYLANLASARKNSRGERDKSRVTIDIEGYRKKREETLRALARRMAAKALRNKRSVMLEPMSAYERRIIHSEIQGIEGVSTNSIGSDNNRKIVIFLTDKRPKELFDEDSADSLVKEFKRDEDDATADMLNSIEVSASAHPDGAYEADDAVLVETIRPAEDFVDDETIQ